MRLLHDREPQTRQNNPIFLGLIASLSLHRGEEQKLASGLVCCYIVMLICCYIVRMLQQHLLATCCSRGRPWLATASQHIAGLCPEDGSNNKISVYGIRIHIHYAC
uniref:Uncharacterized protein n=1 Tax=Glossina brevipalpis TaxID=37001 RepID=A0A1A9X371_9MUSC